MIVVIYGCTLSKFFFVRESLQTIKKILITLDKLDVRNSIKMTLIKEINL